MKNYKILLYLIITLLPINMFGQNQSEESQDCNWFIGSSAFMLMTPILDPSPSFYQLRLGRNVSENGVVTIEAITWKYHQPLGIPYGDSYSDKTENYPGSVRGYGIGLAYQHYIWKGLYTEIHATPFYQKYLNEKDEVIQTGFQLFTVLRVGYHVKLIGDKFFIEPSFAATAWPINTNVPESFKKLDNKWKDYFLVEPGLHFGYYF